MPPPLRAPWLSIAKRNLPKHIQQRGGVVAFVGIAHWWALLPYCKKNQAAGVPARQGEPVECFFRRRVPGPPPFSAMNATPTASRAVRIAAA